MEKKLIDRTDEDETSIPIQIFIKKRFVKSIEHSTLIQYFIIL